MYVALSLWVCISVCLLTEGAVHHDLYKGDICKETEGVVWKCKLYMECPSARAGVKLSIMPEQCNFDGRKAVVCCKEEVAPSSPQVTQSSRMVPVSSPQVAVSSPQVAISSPQVAISSLQVAISSPEVAVSSPVRAKAKEMCKRYAGSMLVDYKYYYVDTCAAVESTMVEGGMNAVPREYPHMALIGYGDKTEITWNCGGSLISERYVLSAAQCTNSLEKGPAKWVRLGEYNIVSTSDDDMGQAQPVDYEIIETINHPGYRQYGLWYNDIALYKLNEDVVINAYFRPICLHTEDQPASTNAITTGWDYMGEGGQKKDILQKANLTIDSGKWCDYVYSSMHRRVNAVNSTTMLCAEGAFPNKDACKGDIGGALQIRLEDPYCMYSLVGITSVGKHCSAHRPNIYTRVSHFVPWIESIVWP